MGTAAAAASAAAAGAGLDHLLSPHPPAQGTPAASGPLKPDSGRWQAVLQSADLPDDAVRAFSTGTLTGFVQRSRGPLHAVSGICTHQGCRLFLASAHTHLVCPCHGATFNLDGQVLAHRLSISLAALPQLAVREAAGHVQVYAPRPD